MSSSPASPLALLQQAFRDYYEVVSLPDEPGAYLDASESPSPEPLSKPFPNTHILSHPQEQPSRAGARLQPQTPSIPVPRLLEYPLVPTSPDAHEPRTMMPEMPNYPAPVPVPAGMQFKALLETDLPMQELVGGTNDEWDKRNIRGDSPKVLRRGVKDFELGEPLGEGSYLTVVKAVDKHTGTYYAVKVLDKRHIVKEKKVKYVNIEKNALHRLGQRAGIVHLHATFQDERLLYYVLDYAQNGELLGLIKKHGLLNEECVQYYAAQLLDGIKYMHDNGVVHRDIKPENILLDNQMRLAITDFGTAKMLERDAETGEYPADVRALLFVGTAEYVLPELLNDKYTLKLLDLWAFACIVFQMVAGKPPFKATNEYLIFQKITKVQYAFTAGFPVVIRDLIKNILKLKPRERLNMRQIRSHYFFHDLDWDRVWDMPAPELGPYKISAKSMAPVPELAKKKLVVPPPKVRVNGRGSSPVPAPAPPASAPLSAPAPASGGSVPSGAQSAPVVASAATAALVALSRGPVVHDHPKGSSGSGSTGPKPAALQSQNYIPGTNILRPQALPRHPLSQRSVTQHHLSASRAERHGSLPHATVTGALHTVVEPTVPPLNLVDLAWAEYFVHHNERVVKVGHVLVLQTTVDGFEKRFKGLISESPLGYRYPVFPGGGSALLQMIQGGLSAFRRGVAVPGLAGSVEQGDSDAVVIIKTEDEENGKEAERVDSESSGGDSSSAPKPSKGSRFRNLIRHGLTLLEDKPHKLGSGALDQRQKRVLLVTTLGRALLFTAPVALLSGRHELRVVISLASPLVRFKEVVSDRRGLMQHSSASTVGTFAIECGKTCFVAEADKLDVGTWTQLLAKLKTLEIERQVRELVSLGHGNEAALKAATHLALDHGRGSANSRGLPVLPHTAAMTAATQSAATQKLQPGFVPSAGNGSHEVGAAPTSVNKTARRAPPVPSPRSSPATAAKPQRTHQRTSSSAVAELELGLVNGLPGKHTGGDTLRQMLVHAAELAVQHQQPQTQPFVPGQQAPNSSFARTLLEREGQPARSGVSGINLRMLARSSRKR